MAEKKKKSKTVTKKKATPKAKEKRKGGPVVRSQKEEILRKLRILANSGQEIGVSNVKLAEELEISTKTLKNYLDLVYSEIRSDDLEKIRGQFEALFNRLFREVHKMLNEAGNDFDKKERAIKLIIILIKEKTDYLERFFVKAKAVDNLAIKGQIDQRVQVDIVLDKEADKIINAKDGRKK